MLAQTTITGCVTTVEVSADEDSFTFPEGITGIGHAICRKADVFDRSTGQGIALGRAIQDFGVQVTAKWEARVVSKETMDSVIALFIRTALE